MSVRFHLPLSAKDSSDFSASRRPFRFSDASVRTILVHLGSMAQCIVLTIVRVWSRFRLTDLYTAPISWWPNGANDRPLTHAFAASERLTINSSEKHVFWRSDSVIGRFIDLIDVVRSAKICHFSWICSVLIKLQTFWHRPAAMIHTNFHSKLPNNETNWWNKTTKTRSFLVHFGWFGTHDSFEMYEKCTRCLKLHFHAVKHK